MEAVLTMAPPPCLSICGISYFMHNHTPLRLTSITRSQSSSAWSAVFAMALSIPALLKPKSSRP